MRLCMTVSYLLLMTELSRIAFSGDEHLLICMMVTRVTWKSLAAYRRAEFWFLGFIWSSKKGVSPWIMNLMRQGLLFSYSGVFLQEKGWALSLQLQRSLFFGGLCYVGVCWRPEKLSSVHKVLQPAPLIAAYQPSSSFLWLLWKPGNPRIAIEWMNHAPTFHFN